MSDPNNSSEDVALSLTLAVVTASPAPLLLLDGQLVVLAVSTSFCEAFGATSADVIGLPLYALDDGEWDSPQVRSLIAATVAGELAPAARDVDFRRPARPVRDLIVQARRLVYLDLEQTRILGRSVLRYPPAAPLPPTLPARSKGSRRATSGWSFGC
jgi:PAS domain-containing protein